VPAAANFCIHRARTVAISCVLNFYTWKEISREVVRACRAMLRMPSERWMRLSPKQQAGPLLPDKKLNLPRSLPRLRSRCATRSPPQKCTKPWEGHCMAMRDMKQFRNSGAKHNLLRQAREEAVKIFHHLRRRKRPRAPRPSRKKEARREWKTSRLVPRTIQAHGQEELLRTAESVCVSTIRERGWEEHRLPWKRTIKG